MYYYTVSSLPYLQLEGEVHVTVDEFLEMCAVELSAGDIALVRSVKLIPEPSDLVHGSDTPRAARAYYEAEAALRNELARLRAGRLGWEAEDYIRTGGEGEDFTSDVHVAERARETFQSESPLEAELLMNRARWAILDELEIGHYFDLDRLVIYYLKLLIMDRRIRMNAADGAEGFAETYDRAALKIEAQNMPL